MIYGFQPSDIALRQLKRRIEYHCDEVAISLLRKQKYHAERSEVYHKKIMKMRLSVNVELTSNGVGQGLAPAVGLLLIYDNFWLQ